MLEAYVKSFFKKHSKIIRNVLKGFNHMIHNHYKKINDLIYVFVVF